MLCVRAFLSLFFSFPSWLERLFKGDVFSDLARAAAMICQWYIWKLL